MHDEYDDGDIEILVKVMTHVNYNENVIGEKCNIGDEFVYEPVR